ncbi:MAG TPA: PHB depolymerase family esterase [Polyangiales bacterium]|nr:PHB depolymerase family esterase [Polyangiales bacterium]
MCSGRPLPQGDSRKTLQHGGLQREYVVHVPPSYDGRKLVPLVIDIHGYTYTEADQEAVSGWQTKSDAEGFIVVYPKGLDDSWNGGSVCCGASQKDGVDDEGFVRAIVKQLSRDACLDEKRIYATGLSNGGALSYLLACRAADVFAATAPVSIGNGTRPCEPARPISVVMYRGKSDDLVPYDGGKSYASAAADLEEWKTLNACTGAPRKVNGVCDQYSDCKAGTEVMLCTIPDGTHILYSDAAKAGAPVADVVWEAFERHALP